MDLEIAGRSAIVCGSSAGLGYGAASALAREGVITFVAARNPDRLRVAAERITRETGGRVHTVVADVATEEGRDTLLTACRDPDILINNAGGPPPGDFRNWSREDWIKAIDTNMLSAIMLIKATIDGMIERQFGRILNITSIMVKQPEAYLGLSNGARSGLTGFVGGLARDVAHHNVTINNVLPGNFDTDRLKATQEITASRSMLQLDDVRERERNRIPAKRFGNPREFGAICAFLCSTHGSYVTGQNILIDGGQFPGLL